MPSAAALSPTSDAAYRDVEELLVDAASRSTMSRFSLGAALHATVGRRRVLPALTWRQVARRRDVRQGQQRSPTLSLRHRHGYAADLPHGLPDRRSCPTRKLSAHAHGGKAPPPALIHQVRAGNLLRDVMTPVPRVLLFVSLAGPAPSGSTDTSRLCQGCSRPPRHHPGQSGPTFHS